MDRVEDAFVPERITVELPDGDEKRGRDPVSLQYRNNIGQPFCIAIIKRDARAARREIPRTQTGNSFIKRQHVESTKHGCKNAFEVRECCFFGSKGVGRLR